MNVVTIGASPYLLTSDGKLNASIIEHLYLKDVPVASFVWGHDVTYYIPEIDAENKSHYYYEFDHNDNKHKIPVVPLKMTSIDLTARVIYELLKLFRPEIIVTVGTFNDFLYMQAVKEFYPNNLKWLSIMSNYNYPISEHNNELTHYMDGVLCTNHFSYRMMRDLSPLDNIETCYVGVETDRFFTNQTKPSGCRVMSCGKNSQSDNLPVLMESVRDLRESHPDMELYLHSNITDSGDYDLSLLQHRFDPNREFITFPKKSVSLSDGYSVENYRKELEKSHIFVSTAISSATCISIFEAIACGCIPIMTDSPCSREVAEGLSRYLEGFSTEDFLFPSVTMMTVGETYLHICDGEKIKNKLRSMCIKLSENKGYAEGLFQFIATKHRKIFLKEMTSMMLKVKEASRAICLDVV